MLRDAPSNEILITDYVLPKYLYILNGLLNWPSQLIHQYFIRQLVYLPIFYAYKIFPRTVTFVRTMCLISSNENMYVTWHEICMHVLKWCCMHEYQVRPVMQYLHTYLHTYIVMTQMTT